MNPDALLDDLRRRGNYRTIPKVYAGDLLDLTGNDYLGLARRDDLRMQFLDSEAVRRLPFTSSASRLLAAQQEEYSRLEAQLEDLYRGRSALLFNSGYHANSGLIPALTEPSDTVILADRLVHASIIDGIMLSKCRFERWRHNDYSHLERLVAKYTADNTVATILIVAESVYSMDGDRADIERLVEIRRSAPGVLLYVDEAHALGVEGPAGLGLTMEPEVAGKVDITVGTFGKALASVGAFAVMPPALRELAVNRSRSLIFSTSLPPVNVAWTRVMMDVMAGMDTERARLRDTAREVAGAVNAVCPDRPVQPGHIVPLVTGSAERAVALSDEFLKRGVKVLPIRTPTVPPGTERLRISLNAAMTPGDVSLLKSALSETSVK